MVIAPEQLGAASPPAPAPAPAAGSSPSKVSRRAGRGVKRSDIVLFVNQMALLLDSAVPVGEALRGLADQASDLKLAAVLDKVTGHVEAGEPISVAFARFPGAFPPIVVALLRAGEASGEMSRMLGRIADYVTKEHKTARQIRGAMVYPAIMGFMCISITVALLTFVLPRFVGIYEGKGATLPGPTRLLMAMSDSITGDWMYWLGGTVGAALIGFIWVRTPFGRVQVDWLKLHSPAFAGLFSRFYLARGFRTLGTMIDTGVPLLDAISIARDVTRNVYFERTWDAVNESVQAGEPFATALEASPVIPNHFVQVVSSGEKSGNLGRVCGRVADFCEDELEQAVKTTTQLIEPLMIIVMGAIIGFIAIALLLPIFKIGQAVAGG